MEITVFILFHSKILDHFRDRGESTDHLLPSTGEVYVGNFQITISLQADSAATWKKAIRISYQNVIVGAQKTTTHINMKGTKGKLMLCCNIDL